MSHYLLSLTLIIIASLGIIFYLKRGWGIGLLFFLMPFERIGAFAIGNHYIRLIQLVALALIGSFIIRSFRLRKWPKIPWLFWPLIAFVLSTFITSVIAMSPRFWQNYASMIFLAATTYVVAQYLIDDGIKDVRRGIFGGALGASLFGLWQFIGDSVGLSARLTAIRPQYSHFIFGTPRIHSVSTEPLYFANYLLIPILLGVVLLLHQKTSLKRWELLSLLLSIAAFVLTLSRGAFVVGALGMIAVLVGLVMSRQINWKYVWGSLIVGLAIIGILLVSTIVVVNRHPQNNTSGSAFIKKFFSRSDVVKTPSYLDRQTRILHARLAWQHAPFFGLGLGRASNDPSSDTSIVIGNLPKRYGYDQVAVFNYYWELLAESGLVGALLMISFVALSVIRGLQTWWQTTEPNRKAWLLASSVTIFVIFLQAYSFTGFYLTYIWVELGLLAGLILTKETKKS